MDLGSVVSVGILAREVKPSAADQVIILTYRSASASSRAGGEGGPRAHKRAAVNKKIKVDKIT